MVLNQRFKKEITQNLKLKSRSSLNPLFLEEDKNQIILKLKDLGYYFSNIEISLEDLEDKRVNVEYKISLGEKAKIKKLLLLVIKSTKIQN